MNHRFRSELPLARIPGTKPGGKVRACFNCGYDLAVSRWDDWNDFLVACPYCRKAHGKKWNRTAILWATFFIHAFSFFFTMRPRKALVLVLAFAFIAIPGYYVLDYEVLPQPIEFVAVLLFVFAPLAINGGLIAVHHRLLGTSGWTKENTLSFLEALLSYFS